MSLLSRKAIDGLVTTGAIAPVRGSLVCAVEAGDAKAAAAVRGIATLFEAANILAGPSAVLEVTEVKRGAAPFMARVFVRADRACSAVEVADGVSVEAPLSVGELTDRLAARLAGPKSTGLGLLTSELAMVAHLWPEQKRSLANALSAEVCVQGLVAAGIDADAAKEALEALQRTQVLSSTARGLAVPKALAAVLESFWSGDLLEVKVGSFDGARSMTLLWVGPAKHRFLVERVAPAVWQRTLGSRSASDEALLVFQRLPRADAGKVLTTAFTSVTQRL